MDKKKRSRRFTNGLERKAREISSWRDKPDKKSPVSMLRKDIIFTLDQIQNQRTHHEVQREELLNTECQLTTEIMHVDDRTPKYTPERYPEREKFLHRLLEVEREKRRLDTQHEEKLDELHRKLLDLINKHELLDI